jgi:putative transposase
MDKTRRSIRLAGYEYSNAGAYFVTFCAHEKRHVFGRVESGAMHLNVYGEMVRDEWFRTAELRPNVVLDEFVVMPNHFHAIVIITCDTNCETISKANVGATRRVAPTLQSNSLGSIIGQFKSMATKRINVYRAERGLPVVRVWQRNFYERIIRHETELDETRRYIGENPIHWATDEYAI